MLILGLTGNIGCGKSSLSNLFIEYNIDVIDADNISRQIFEDEKLLNEVFKTFGESIKNSDGSLNRKALGNIVFNNDKKLVILNSLTHPRIRAKILEKVEDIRNLGKEIAIIDAALLVEGGYLEIIDKLLVVVCSENIQLARIQNRDNCTEEEALSRMKSQMKQSEKAKYGDYIIDNSATLEELRAKAQDFIKFMKENWCE